MTTLRLVTRGLRGSYRSTMGIGPVPATARTLDAAGLTLADMDLIELNEAMARRDARYGLETMCIGGGQGLAAIVERV